MFLQYLLLHLATRTTSQAVLLFSFLYSNNSMRTNICKISLLQSFYSQHTQGWNISFFMAKDDLPVGRFEC